MSLLPGTGSGKPGATFSIFGRKISWDAALVTAGGIVGVIMLAKYANAGGPAVAPDLTSGLDVGGGGGGGFAIGPTSAGQVLDPNFNPLPGYDPGLFAGTPPATMAAYSTPTIYSAPTPAPTPSSFSAPAPSFSSPVASGVYVLGTALQSSVQRTVAAFTSPQFLAAASQPSSYTPPPPTVLPTPGHNVAS